MNAVILTALLARELFPADQRVTKRQLALSTDVANLVLMKIGAMPMCHGAGGLMAQHRFGVRTDLAPVLLGVLLLMFGLGYAADAMTLARELVEAGCKAAEVLEAVEASLDQIALVIELRRDADLCTLLMCRRHVVVFAGGAMRGALLRSRSRGRQ